MAEGLATLPSRTGRSIVFTEVGYRSQDGALARPWEWDTDGPVNLALQRDAFDAMLDALWERPWFGGTIVWKWHPDLNHRVGRVECDFTPQGKPALEVIRSWYGAGAP